MEIAIIGAGKVGRALGAGWVKAGHKVTMAVRDPQGAASALKEQGFAVVGQNLAAAAAEAVVLAIPWAAVASVMRNIGPLAGKIVIDATNPLRPDMSLAVGYTDSAGETVARLAPGARVIKAFNTTGFGNMADSRYSSGKLMMLVAGDDPQAKAITMSLATDLGFEAIDAGPLLMSRYLEPMAMVWIKLAAVQGLGRDIGFALLRRSPD
jgi:predicted dinucleotide-binding enzyme